MAEFLDSIASLKGLFLLELLSSSINILSQMGQSRRDIIFIAR